MPTPRALAPLRLLAALLAPLAASTAFAFQVRAGIGLVHVTGAPVGAELVLSEPGGLELQRGTTDRFGSLVFRYLPQGATVAVRDAAGGDPALVRVLVFEEHPDEAFYRAKTLVDGYQYLETRDGTLLAVMVRPPLGRRLSDGPFPTVVEYSGYDPANPTGTEPVSLIASGLGYATVGVNMRGSGCSGGVLDLFDLPTTADGYDVIETVAAQPWVAGGRVGMVGISFSGISQVFVGGARPPHLAAVTPLSVLAEIYRSPGFPGGIFNDGFAQSWLEERKRDAEPAPDGGQGWARDRVNAGDEVCRANQTLREQTLDPIEFVRTHPYYEAELLDPRSPANWIGGIEVPTYLAGAWQDEQTGPGFAAMLHRLRKGRDVKVVVANGVHSTTLEPEILWSWIAFLDLYVARRLPDPGRAAPFAGFIYPQILGSGTPTPPVPADRFDGIADLDRARALFEAAPRVRVLMENGAGTPTPGLPAPTFELGFAKWPPRDARPTAWYLGPEGTLSRSRPRGEDAGAVDAYRPDPGARPQTTLRRGGSWDLMPDYDWRPITGESGLGWSTPPLDGDVTVVGTGSVDLWLRSSAPDTDLQVTLSEVRPDGLEAYVQSGWLRASHRRLDRRRSTVISPRPTHLERDARPLPPGEFSKARVELMAAAHVFRRGSRMRITVEAPGGDRTEWRFDTPRTNGAVLNEIARTGTRASRLVLPVVRGATPPPALPPCPGLRGQPCRTFVPAANGG